jgi:putative spermidine/putrescine transport system ATP-binding protein
MQQIGTPEEVYSQPSNTSVARFMGYRNMLELDIESVAGDEVTLRGSWGTLRGTVKQELPVPRAFAAMRPDEIVIGPAGAPNTIPGEVSNVEYYGRDCLVELSIPGGERLYARAQGRLERGAAVHATVPAARVLVYPAHR